MSPRSSSFFAVWKPIKPASIETVSSIKYDNSPIGRFVWRRREDDIGAYSVDKEMAAEATASGDDWPPLKAGLFDGSLEKFQSIQATFGEQLATLHWL